MRLNISRAARANVFVRPERLCSGGTVSRSPALGCLKTDPVRVQSPGRGVITILAGAVICLSTTVALAEGPLKFRDSQLEPIKWGELAGWTADDHLAAFATYQGELPSSAQIATQRTRRAFRRPVQRLPQGCWPAAAGYQDGSLSSSRLSAARARTPGRVEDY